MRTWLLASLLLCTSCRQLLGIDEPAEVDAPTPPPDDAILPDCTAQRMVHVIAGTGGFAWFTLVWPAPRVITQFAPTFSYDDPTAAKDLTTLAAHPLFARRVGAVAAVWEGRGADPHPSVFVAGSNETHTPTPSSIAIVGGVGLDAAAASIQARSTLPQPAVPVLLINNAGPYGNAQGAPATTQVIDVDDGVVLLANGSATVAAELMPSTAQLARYLPQNAAKVEEAIGTRLAFTANALRLGLVSTVMIQAFNDDPHAAFASGIVGTRANNLALTLDAFYADLAAATETGCGRGGNPLSLADNVVFVVTGDTPKNSFDNNSWPDGTPGNSNWVYVRSNGFTVPGWFGDIDPSTRTNWDPQTGALAPGGLATASTAAAWAGALYAVSRGDRLAVGMFTSAPFDGVIRR